MGWTFTSEKRNEESAIDYIKRRVLKWDCPEAEHPQVIDAAKVGSTCYFAVKYPADFVARIVKDGGFTDYIPDSDGSVTAAVVILTKTDSRAFDGCTFGYKDMDEGMGPRESKCPLRLINRLSKIVPEGKRYAADWRARCVANARKPKSAAWADCAKVMLPTPILFTDGKDRQRFWVCRYPQSPRKIRFECMDTGTLCRLSRDQIAALQPYTEPAIEA